MTDSHKSVDEGGTLRTSVTRWGAFTTEIRALAVRGTVAKVTSRLSPLLLVVLAAFRCVHRKADEEGIPGRITTEENAARWCLGVAKREQ